MVNSVKQANRLAGSHICDANIYLSFLKQLCGFNISISILSFQAYYTEASKYIYYDFLHLDIYMLINNCWRYLCA